WCGTMAHPSLSPASTAWRRTSARYEALAWLCGGLSFFAALGLAAVVNDKASKMPYTPKVYPFDNLRAELGDRS
uniref:Uncharacterized protein n=1 Tax=Aegilops tauschii subsp. strangulata TaxID=200361 RepID=A0A452YTT2_AEGTS